MVAYSISGFRLTPALKLFMLKNKYSLFLEIKRDLSII